MRSPRLLRRRRAHAGPNPGPPQGDAGGAALDARGVTKAYGTVAALRGVDVRIEPGQILALLGPNGAGKSTFISAVCGLVRPDAGSIRVAGFDPVARSLDARRHLGLAPQELAIYPTLRVRDNLTFLGELKGLRGAASRHRVGELAELLDLAPLLDRRAGDLSGGQQRRLHVAMALLSRPTVLLLDEPTAGVDVESRADILRLVRSLADDGVAVCYSTHYLPEVEALGALTVILRAGRVVARGEPHELARRHGSSSISLTFRGSLPGIFAPGRAPGPPFPYRTTVEGTSVRVHTAEPHLALRDLVLHLGDELAALDSLSIERPTLDSAFTALVRDAPHDAVDRAATTTGAHP
jgi:ABC-2 type transport system ATP-binding protein